MKGGCSPVGLNLESGKELMNSIIYKIGGVCCTLLLIATVPTKARANLVQNGDFATGNLSDWMVFLTTDGNLGAALGLPDVVPFTATGTGPASDAAKFQAGQVTFKPSVQCGGGIDQTFSSSAGIYNLSADIAADEIGSVGNAAAGLFTLLLDGTPVTSVNLGHINPGQILRSDLEATVPLSQGSHQLAIEITRPYLSGGSPELVVLQGETPFEYLDNIQITQATAVPERTSLGLISLGALFVCWSMRSLKKWL
jgi:hypothetical protein